MKITAKLVALILLTLASFLFVKSDTANAQTTPPYTDYDFSSVNLYAYSDLGYAFSGMTPGDRFNVYLERLNNDGSVHSLLQRQVCVADGSGECVIGFSGSTNPTAWALTDQFPMRVTDSFFNVLGYHFLASAPVTSWGSEFGLGDEPDKVCIGGCINNEETVNNNHHNPSLTLPDKYKILTFEDDYAILHYRCDFNTPDADDKVQITNIDTGTVVFEAFISEFKNYNSANDVFGFQFACNNPIVLNVTGEHLNFIDSTRDAAAAWSIDNPHEMTFAPGGYAYARVDHGMADAVIREGMSVWGVTSDPNRENWTLEMRQTSIPTDSQQRAIRRAVDESLYDSFPEMELEDSLLGLLDPTDYAFFTFKQNFFNVSGVAGAATATWTMQATDLYYGQDVTEYQLIAPSNYTVVDGSAGLDRQQQLLDAQAQYGFDSDAGSLILFLILTILLFGGMAILGVRIPQLYGLGFVALAAIYIGFGATTTFSAFIIGLAAIVALLATLVMIRANAVGNR